MPSSLGQGGTSIAHRGRGRSETRDTDLRRSVSSMLESYREHGGVNLMEDQNLPSRDEVSELLDQLLAVLFPGYFGLKRISESDAEYAVGNALHHLVDSLKPLIERSLKWECRLKVECPIDVCAQRAQESTERLLWMIPAIRELLAEDIQAAYEGDPAAKSTQEVILSYPAVLAIATYRLAHELFVEGIPVLPRMMTERAHSLTGIDIHPGASIGRAFFIDHGTGTVIGETTVIGDNVKLYQGVTLGALSFPRDANGKMLRANKRHPTIEDNVVVYAGATILGGDTVIGHDSIIGGNCWIVASVPPNTKVSVGEPDQVYRSQGTGIRAVEPAAAPEDIGRAPESDGQC